MLTYLFYEDALESLEDTYRSTLEALGSANAEGKEQCIHHRRSHAPTPS